MKPVVRGCYFTQFFCYFLSLSFSFLFDCVSVCYSVCFDRLKTTTVCRQIPRFVRFVFHYQQYVCVCMSGICPVEVDLVAHFSGSQHSFVIRRFQHLVFFLPRCSSLLWLLLLLLLAGSLPCTLLLLSFAMFIVDDDTIMVVSQSVVKLLVRTEQQQKRRNNTFSYSALHVQHTWLSCALSCTIYKIHVCRGI